MQYTLTRFKFALSIYITECAPHCESCGTSGPGNCDSCVKSTTANTYIKRSDNSGCDGEDSRLLDC